MFSNFEHRSRCWNDPYCTAPLHSVTGFSFSEFTSCQKGFGPNYCLDTFILSIWHLVMIFLLPVAVTNMSILSTTSLTLTTRYPSMQAVEFNSYYMAVWWLTFFWNVIILPWIAQSGSISVTYTTQPKALKALQHPLPTSPYPHTSTCLPASIESVTLWSPEIRFHH